MGLLEIWIARLAALLGLVALALPLGQLWRVRLMARGRGSGTFRLMLRAPAIAFLTLAFLGAGVLLWIPLPLDLPAGLRVLLALIGAGLYFPGIVLYVWGFKTLGAMFGVSSSMAAELYTGHNLVERGPYRLVRHPMYLGVLLAALGALLIFRTWTMALYAPLSFGILIRARREEALLAAEFGEQWEDYARRVPGWLPRFR